LETLIFLGVLDVKKIRVEYHVHLCDASEGAKEDFVVCYTCLQWIFGEDTSFSWEILLSRRSWWFGFSIALDDLDRIWRA
jgi:hypothetical protein